MLFSADGPTPAFARVLGRGEQLLRVGVGDDQLAFGVGQQDRVGHGVDDAVQQHPLLAEPDVGERPGLSSRDACLAKQPRQPYDVRLDLGCVGAHQQQPQRVRLVVRPQRDGVESVVADADVVQDVEKGADRDGSAEENGARCEQRRGAS